MYHKFQVTNFKFKSQISNFDFNFKSQISIHNFNFTIQVTNFKSQISSTSNKLSSITVPSSSTSNKTVQVPQKQFKYLKNSSSTSKKFQVSKNFKYQKISSITVQNFKYHSTSKTSQFPVSLFPAQVPQTKQFKYLKNSSSTSNKISSITVPSILDGRSIIKRNTVKLQWLKH